MKKIKLILISFTLLQFAQITAMKKDQITFLNQEGNPCKENGQQWRDSNKLYVVEKVETVEMNTEALIELLKEQNAKEEKLLTKKNKLIEKKKKEITEDIKKWKEEWLEWRKRDNNKLKRKEKNLEKRKTDLKKRKRKREERKKQLKRKRRKQQYCMHIILTGLALTTELLYLMSRDEKN